jgi:hypothetical protein
MLTNFDYRQLWSNVWRKSWILSTCFVLVGFVFLGANSYASDVAIIETEMVNVARWVRDHTSSSAFLGVHDIGAIGYFARRPIIDLAGLVSPDVIPFIRDEEKLRLYLDQNQAKYLVTFPGWYPNLVRNLQQVYSSRGEFAVKAGGENMVVYLWRAGNP